MCICGVKSSSKAKSVQNFSHHCAPGRLRGTACVWLPVIVFSTSRFRIPLSLTCARSFEPKAMTTERNDHENAFPRHGVVAFLDLLVSLPHVNVSTMKCALFLTAIAGASAFAPASQSRVGSQLNMESLRGTGPETGNVMVSSV